MVLRKVALTVALALAPWAADAGNTSSNSSSKCSGGRCTVIETHSFDDDRGRRGVVGQYRSWVEPGHGRWIGPYDRPRPWRDAPRRRWRQDRDD